MNAPQIRPGDMLTCQNCFLSPNTIPAEPHFRADSKATMLLHLQAHMSAGGHVPSQLFDIYTAPDPSSNPYAPLPTLPTPSPPVYYRMKDGSTWRVDEYGNIRQISSF